jgi:hypothetical protein
MMIKRLQSTVALLAMLFISGCEPVPESALSETMGYKPVYRTEASAVITLSDPLPVNEPGKIYEYGAYLFVNEINKGIHVFDNTDPQQPVALAFLNILGNTEMAIKNNILYANYLGNIVAVDLKDLTHVETLASLPLQTFNGGVLPPKGYYFECIAREKGVVVNWVLVERNNMDCYAIR